MHCKSRKGTRTRQSCKPLRPSKRWKEVEEPQPSSETLLNWINTPVCLKEPIQTTALDLHSCLLLIQLQWWKIIGLPPIMIQAEGWKDATYKSHHRSHNFLWRSHPSTTLKRLVCKYRGILINLVHFWVHFILKYVQIVCRCYSNDVLGWVPCCVQDLLSKVQTVNTDVIFPPFASNADSPGLKNGSWLTALPGGLQGDIPLGVAVKHSKKVVICTCHYHTAERQRERETTEAVKQQLVQSLPTWLSQDSRVWP